MKEAREFALLRRRDSLRKRRQVWVAGVVVWGVVVGWVLFGVVNSFTDDVDVRLSWLLTWLAPMVVLVAGTLVTSAQLRSNQAELEREAS